MKATFFRSIVFLLVFCFSKAFGQCPDATIRIEVFTDDFPEETTFQLVDQNTGSLIAFYDMAGLYSPPLYYDEICVSANGCYIFTIFDDFGDGICCGWGSGYYNVFFNGNLVATGGDFGSSETVSNIGGCATVIQGDCSLNTSANPETILCGECTNLNASGQGGAGFVVFTEDFNNGAATGWSSTIQARYDNPCSPNGVDGTIHMWMGNTSPVPRILETFAYDFSTATAGATICFDLLFARQTGSGGTTCEGPDEPDEGVYLQYSTNGGGSWNTIHYFNPNGGTDPQLVNWNNWCFQLPPGAMTSSTQFRWYQDNDSGADFDHWGIDNVRIYFNDPNYTITWLHDGYSYGLGSSGGTNPNAVCPDVNTTYTALMTNGTDTCTSTVTVIVNNPEIIVDAGEDVTICQPNCVVLDGEVKVIIQ